MFHMREMRELHCDHIARVAPTLLCRDSIRQNIHCVRYQKVGVTVEFHQMAELRGVLEPMLVIGGIYDSLASVRKAIAVRVTGQVRRRGSPLYDPSANEIGRC